MLSLISSNAFAQGVGGAGVEKDLTPTAPATITAPAPIIYYAPNYGSAIWNGDPSQDVGVSINLAIGAALTGGGSVTCPVFHNGTTWVGG